MTIKGKNSIRVFISLGVGIILLIIVLALAQRPRSVLDQQSTTRSSKILKVNRGDDFQRALNEAQSGDTIMLEAGGTFVGPFTLPVKTGTEYITIQSSRLSELPGDGQRISPSQAGLMPKLVSPGEGQSALKTVAAAHHYRLIGIEIAPMSERSFIYDLLALGEAGATQRTFVSVPHHLTLDRCYIHAYPDQSLKRGVALNSAYTDIVNSYIAGFKVVGQDSQAIAGWNGPGPYRIINNYLEAAGENILFGGAPAAIANLVPADIEIRRNYIYKPLRWRIGDPSYGGTPWSVKNLFELKTGRRVTIDGNVFENNWAQAQTGFAILFNSIDDTGSWARIEDVTFSNNIVRHSGQGFNIRGSDPSGSQAARITIRNNLFEDINSATWGGDGRLFQVYKGATDVVINHNTGINNSLVISATDAPSTGFVYTNNITRHNAYGVFGDMGYLGIACLDQYYPGWTFARNVLAELPADVSSSQYPTDNFFPTSLNAQFVDAANGNYRLSQSSTYRGMATDGKDIGCDFNELEAAQAGIIVTPPPAPAPTGTPIPTPTPTPTPAPPGPGPSGDISHSNPIDDPRTFVRDHYLDFLNREPDSSGWDYWTSAIASCSFGDARCIVSKRISVSAAFFAEPEFQQTGSFVYRLYRSSLRRTPAFSEFMPDRAEVVDGPNLEANKQAFADVWVQRSEFIQRYPGQLEGTEFIDALLQTAQQSSGVDLSFQRPLMIADWNKNGSRASIVRLLADTPAYVQVEYNKMFVLMQYFGYLRRDPDTGGYDYWLNVLGSSNNNYRGMVCAFITSAEYQRRFGSTVTHTNSDCGQ